MNSSLFVCLFVCLGQSSLEQNQAKGNKQTSEQLDDFRRTWLILICQFILFCVYVLYKMKEDKQYLLLLLKPVMFQVDMIMLIFVYTLDYTKLLIILKDVSNNTWLNVLNCITLCISIRRFFLLHCYLTNNSFQNLTFFKKMRGDIL